MYKFKDKSKKKEALWFIDLFVKQPICEATRGQRSQIHVGFKNAKASY
jgi:hypothetical protein